MFIKDTQPKPFARAVAGVQVGESHYSIRVVGHQSRAVSIVTEIQLVIDAEVVVCGREAIVEKLAALAAQPVAQVDDARWLLRALDGVKLGQQDATDKAVRS